MKINSIDANYEIVRRAGLSHTNQSRISIRGNDGSVSNFLIQFAQPEVTRSDSRNSQMFDLLNSIVSSNQLCRQRNMSITTPIIVPITPRIRLLKEAKTFVVLSSIYDDYYTKNGGDELEPFLMNSVRYSPLGHPV